MAPEPKPGPQPARLSARALSDVGGVAADEGRLPLEIGVDQPDEPEPEPQDLDPTDQAPMQFGA